MPFMLTLLALLAGVWMLHRFLNGPNDTSFSQPMGRPTNSLVDSEHTDDRLKNHSALENSLVNPIPLPEAMSIEACVCSNAQKRSTHVGILQCCEHMRSALLVNPALPEMYRVLLDERHFNEVSFTHLFDVHGSPVALTYEHGKPWINVVSRNKKAVGGTVAGTYKRGGFNMLTNHWTWSASPPLPDGNSKRDKTPGFEEAYVN